MYRAPSKRKKRAQLFFIYSLMVTAVIAIVSVLILVILGYRFNKFDGHIEQGGLVQFDSRPSGATVNVDSVVLANKTASKITLTTGKHTITMTRDGYRAWKKDVNVRAGSILWLNYALMIPNEPASKSVFESPVPASVQVSPDRKYLATVPNASEPVISVMQINDSAPVPITIPIAEDAFTAPAAGKQSTFSLVDWDKDSRRIIVRHTFNDSAVEYLSVDTRGQNEARNVTSIVGIGIRALEYSLSDSNQMYVLTDTNEIRRVQLSNSIVSGPLLSNIASFSQGDRSTIAYTTLPEDATKHRSLGYWTTSSATPRVVKTVIDKGSRPADIKMSTYFNDKYIVLTNGTDVQILIGNLPVSDSDSDLSLTQIAKYSLPSEQTSGDFSPITSRFVASEFAGGIWTYDLEIRQLNKTTLQGAAPARPLDWLNAYHFATTNDGTFAYYDFDGLNRQVVAENVADLPVAMSENNKYFYHYVPSEKGVILVQTKLTLN